MDGNAGLSVDRSTTLVRTEISQQLLDCKCGADMHVPHRMESFDNFDEYLNFHLVPSSELKYVQYLN